MEPDAFFEAAEAPRPHRCPTCGTPYSRGDEGFGCPVCMLRRVLEPGAEEDPGLPGYRPSRPEEGRFDHYEIARRNDGSFDELGRGAMGITYKAFDVHLRCPVTLKLINEKYVGDESARLRFLREARAAASLRHPNVASVFHLGQSSRGYFYVMEFVEGETLERLIKRSGRLEVKLALEIATQVTAGLAAVHKQKLVHRDIKPSNIMVNLEESGVVSAKIIDLGLAKAFNEPVSQSEISTPGVFVGTPAFASPEQFTSAHVDIRSDLYSLGVTLWEMLTGQTPFRGSPTEVMDLHQREPLPLEQLKRVPQPVVALLEVLLEKDPGRRLQSPANLLDALPKVTDAVKARRAIARQSLREIEAEPVGAPGKVIAILTKIRDALEVRRVRQFLWPALVISGGAILAVSIFFAPKIPAPQASKSSSPAISAPEKSIAVLPFESLSENKSDSYFADGVQDEILSNLAKAHQLTVISRTSVMTYRSTNNRDLRSIANALGVANVVEGTVRRDGNRVRVTTELVDARTDQTLWSDSYDRELTDIFAIQSEIAQTVASKLSAQLSPEERTDIQRKPTDDLEAYDLYLQGKAMGLQAMVNFSWENERELALNAIRFLEEATRKDPRLALAYCSLAQAHDLLYLFHLDRTPERRALGDAAVNEALRLQPDLPEAHLASAVHLVAGYRDYERARVQIAIAERGLPNSAEVFWYRADIDVRQGRYEESIRGFERAAILDPRNPKILLDLQAIFIKLRRFREDEQTIDRIMNLEPDEQGLKVWKAYDAMGEKADLKNLLNVLETLPAALKDRADIISSRFQAAVFARDWTNAEEILGHSANEEFFFTDTPGAKVPRKCLEIWLARLRGRNPATEVRFTADRDQLKRNVEAHPEDAVLLSMLGIIDAALGRKEEAIQEARRAVEMLPISEDGESGPSLISNLAVVYALTNEPNLAFEELNVSVRITGGVNYGELKLDPAWDPIRTDPRFDKLLAQLAPKE